MKTTFLLAAVLLTVGCTDGSSTSEGTGSPTTLSTPDLPTIADDLFVDATGQDEVDVDVIDNSFEERYLTVSAGTTVVWTNKGRVEHNVTPSVDDSFVGVDSAGFPPDATHSVTFDEPGDYLYYCTIHGTLRNGQTGAVRVVS